jgi:hypothetical protein
MTSRVLMSGFGKSIFAVASAQKWRHGDGASYPCVILETMQRMPETTNTRTRHRAADPRSGAGLHPAPGSEGGA